MAITSKGMSGGRVMYMTLKREPFERILAGVKKVEYRGGTEYWCGRLLGKTAPKYIRFANGYSPDAPAVTVECLGIRAALGDYNWAEDPNLEKDFSADSVALDEAEREADNIASFQIKVGNIVKRENIRGVVKSVSRTPLNPRKYITK